MDNPTDFTNPFQFEITFECLQELDDGTFTKYTRSSGRRSRMHFFSPYHPAHAQKKNTTQLNTFSHHEFPLYEFVNHHSLHLLFLFTDLEWKVLYVGSAKDASRDQVLDEILVGPVPVGTNKFVLQADAPDPSQLPPEDLLGVTVVLVTCSYKEREFVRVGYYVNNEYHDPNAPPVAEGEEAPPPPQPIPLHMIKRHILADKPRVTKFPISWGDEDVLPQQAQAAAGQEQQQQQSSLFPAQTGGMMQQQPQLQSPSGIVSMQEESNLSAVAPMME